MLGSVLERDFGEGSVTVLALLWDPGVAADCAAVLSLVWLLVSTLDAGHKHDSRLCYSTVLGVTFDSTTRQFVAA